MDHVSSMEERIVTERIRRKLEEVNAAAEKHLAGVQDHVNFTMQQAYFKCAYDCFDRRRSQEGINNCVENCSVPVLSANNVVETEMAKFQLDNGPGQSQFGWLTPTSASLGSSCQLSSTRWSTMSTSSSDSNTFNRLFLELYTAWLFFKREEYWWSGLSMMVVLTMWVNMLPLYGFFLRKKPPLGHILASLTFILLLVS